MLISHGHSVEPRQDTDCKIKDSEGRLNGWIRFDNNDETDIRNLGCVIIAQQNPLAGWGRAKMVGDNLHILMELMIIPLCRVTSLMF